MPATLVQLAFLLLGLTLTQVAVGNDEVDASRDHPVVGIVSVKPVSGPMVETDQGYMVSYSARIPSTRIEYSMVPVPGGKYKVERDGRTFYVAIEPFWIGKTEVTWAEYWEYMKLYLHFDKFERRKLRVLTEDNKIDAVSGPTSLYETRLYYDFGKQPT